MHAAAREIPPSLHESVRRTEAFIAVINDDVFAVWFY